MDIQTTSVSRWCIHIVINTKFGKPWVLSSLYASPKKILEGEFGMNFIVFLRWVVLWLLLVISTLLLRLETKKGGLPPLNKLSELNDVFCSCNLINLEVAGPRFTWSNKQMLVLDMCKKS